MKTIRSLLLLSTVGLLSVAPSRADLFTASDVSANEPYASQENWNLGDNGGSGFEGWRQIGAEPSRSLDSGGFAISGDGGAGRSFANGTALATGTFSVQATHDTQSTISHFSGFALYSAGDTEILRWGVGTAEDRDDGVDKTGFWYSIGTGGQNDYTLIARTDTTPLAADYSISWSVFSSGMAIDLSINSGTYTRHLDLDNSSAVTAIGALIAGSSQSETLHFDNLEVEGLAVPEPSTLILLLLGTLALCPRKLHR